MLPAASRAVNVTVVAPRGKIAGALLDTATGPLTMSLATGIGTATDVPDGPACSTVMGGGTPLNVGGVVSTTVTVVADERRVGEECRAREPPGLQKERKTDG